MMLFSTTTEMLLFWAQVLIPIFFIIFPVYLGNRFGIKYKSKVGDVADGPVGSVVAAGLGLLAFMLAFTFEITASRYEKRKELFLDHVTTIRTAFLRAGLLSDSTGNECKRLLTEYVDILTMASTKPTTMKQAKLRSKQIQDSLWMQAQALNHEDRSSETYSLFTSSVNDLLDFHHKRIVVALEYRIPQIIMNVLYFISFFAMLMLGFQFGVTGKSNLTINLLLAVIFSAVMWLIFSLDNPSAGFINVNQAPLLQLQEELHEAMGKLPGS